MSGTLERRVLAFLATELLVSRSDLKPDTRLRRDLGVDGTDAVELFLKFASKFNVDMSTCDLQRYFGPEGWGPTGWLFRVISGRTLVSIRAADLVRAAEHGHWVEPTSETERSRGIRIR